MLTNRALLSIGRELGSALILLYFGAAGAIVFAADKAAPAAPCTSCHDQGDKLAKSAHKDLTCDTCHDSHEKYPHPANIAKPQCVTCHADQAGDYDQGVHGLARKAGNDSAPDCALCHGSAHEMQSPKSQAFRMAVPDTCGMCHSEVVEQYRGSVHGKALAAGITQAPLCTDCHGEHKIIKHTSEASPVNSAHIRDTCGSCHDNVRLTQKFGLPSDRLVSFDSSFHGLAAKAGSQTVANCASCHGVHNILPSSDPNSTINAKNLPKTCGQCHPGAGTRFAISQVHVAQGKTEPTMLRWVREFYLLLIPVTIGLMLIHQGGDWVRKLIRLRFQKQVASRSVAASAAGDGHIRMLPFERVQHALLAISFITLVWTGFALKYPDTWWAKPLLILEGTHSMRSIIHRVAAVIFIAVSVTHLVSLIVSRKLRNHWKEMLPKLQDAREASAGFAYNMGLGSVPPHRSAHSYVEKAEYWAVVWGAIVMASTGLLLWANNLAMRLLPKSWLDIATSVHFYEALLATLAIVVWHFYSIIFDPDVYPLNTAFLTGYSSKKTEHSRSSTSPLTLRETNESMPTENTDHRRGGWLSPLVHLSNNWISLAGVIVVTTATIFWLFLLPVTLRGETPNPYLGILVFLGLPAPFFAGLIMIPLGIWLKHRREGRTGLYPSDFPALSWGNSELRKLAYFFGVTTFLNLAIASQLTYGAVNYMESVTFCGQTCHTVMQPEYTAYQESPHSRVECVKCHIGAGASWFVKSKLSGTRQLFAVSLHTYPTPIPTPVHNLRPARETCEQCHWPQKYGEDRLKVIPKYASDETNTLSKTVLLMKIGGGNKGIGIHGTHLGPGITIRYRHSDESRQTIPWVEYDNKGKKTEYISSDVKKDTAGMAERTMDCMDCHNRPAHSYDLPDRGVDKGMNNGSISASLPFAKKKAIEILKVPYLSRDEAAEKIPAAFAKFYQDSYPAIWAQREAEVRASGKGVLAVYDRNIFPEMKVTWGAYPINIGHEDFPGCFRCHDGAHSAKSGESITQDCNACHNLLATEEKDPKVLTDLGIEEKKQ